MFLSISPTELIAEFINAPPEWLIHPLFRAGILVVGILVFLGMLAWSRRIRARGAADLTGQRISARQAHQYLAYETKWGWRTWLAMRGMWEAVHLTGMDRFNKAARQGVVHLRGRPAMSGAHEDIDPDLWTRIRIKESSILDGTRNLGETESASTSHPQPPQFNEVTTDAGEVYATWPQASRVYRMAMRARLGLLKTWWLIIWPFEVAYRRWKRWRISSKGS